MQDRLRAIGRDAGAAVVEAGLPEGGAQRLVAENEPVDERHPGAPHVVEQLRDPARLERDRDGLRIRWLGVPAELRDPEPHLLARADVACLGGGVQDRSHRAHVAERRIAMSL